MSYVVPSVLVYQQLSSVGAVLNATPDLDTVIIGPCNNVVEYDPTSATTLAASAATLAGGAIATLTSGASTTTYLPSPKVGQVVSASSLSVVLNNSFIETKTIFATGTAGSNVLTIATIGSSAAGSMTSGSNQLTSVSGDTNPISVGDNITVAGAGVAGAALTTYVTGVTGTGGSAVYTLFASASTAVISAVVTRTSFNNTNPVTSTLRADVGDSIVVTSGGTTFQTTILSLTGSASAITAITLTDILPVGLTFPVSVSIRKKYNNLVLPVTYNSNTNYSSTNVSIDGSVVVNANPKVAYGTVKSGEVHIAYTALRQDLSGQILEIANVDDQVGQLGVATDSNPLALGVNLALANTTGRIMAVAIQSDDLTGYMSALDLCESARVYCMVPLTQDISILTAFKQHVEQMSTPENAAWRIAMVNTAVPSVKYIGQYNPNLVNSNGGNITLTATGTAGQYILLASNATFVSDGVIPGDSVKVTVATPTSVQGALTVLGVISNQQLLVQSTAAASGISYYVERKLSKLQQAQFIADTSSAFASNRVIHVQPDLVGVIINAVTKYLPGYYLCAATAGLVSGLPVQQSLTNIAPAGIADLSRSNFYYTRAQLSTIAAAGTLLMVQESQGSIPYVRHSLTTDLTALAYRELQQVKNWDFLSYAFYDALKGYIGRYNITADTLQVIRTAILAEASLLQGKKLPRIGAPLVSCTIKTLKQDPLNQDNVIAELLISIPTVMNYISLYLIL